MAVENIYYGVNGQSKAIDKLYAPTPDGKSILIYEKPQDKHIYGVEWSGTSVTNMLRTDDSANFAEPVPYYVGMSESPSSPFDECYPWKDIKRVTDSVAGELVEIPKFWFKIAKNGSKMTFQIADYAADGFYTSPAHMDRGDDKGERDVVYVGRYHCDSNYKSNTGVVPQVSRTRANCRSGIHNLGNTFWQFDYAMLVTIWLLYLIEFADFDCQKKIGAGCLGNQKSGSSDSMPYHTGTMKTNRTDYGSGCQYRWIEDLWSNGMDMVDGIRYNTTAIYAYKNPSEFSDASGGVQVGSRPTTNGYQIIRAFFVSNVSGYEWFMHPSEVGASTGGSDDNSYTTDAYYYHAQGVKPKIGGASDCLSSEGLFYMQTYGTSSFTDASHASRLMKLP